MNSSGGMNNSATGNGSYGAGTAGNSGNTDGSSHGAGRAGERG